MMLATHLKPFYLQHACCRLLLSRQAGPWVYIIWREFRLGILPTSVNYISKNQRLLWYLLNGVLRSESHSFANRVDILVLRDSIHDRSYLHPLCASGKTSSAARRAQRRLRRSFEVNEPLLNHLYEHDTIGIIAIHSV